MIINILIFILSAIFIAAAVTFTASLDARIAGEAFGYSFDAPAGFIIGALLVILFVSIYATAKIKDIIAFRQRMKVREREARQARGIAALTRGLEAVAIGDASDASHHARIAERQLDDIALTRLLSAQAAHLSGDTLRARRSFEAMADAPETEFLGLKGMFHLEMQSGEEREAKDYAHRAFALRRNARWAFDAVIDLAIKRGEWGDLRSALDQAARNKLIEPEIRARGVAGAYTASAHDGLSDDKEAALKDVEAALKVAPGFAPAACLAAQILSENGKTGRAEKILETAFGIDPYPALIAVYDKVTKTHDEPKRAKRWRRLAAKNPETPEAVLARAHAFLAEEDWRGAIKEIEPVLSERPGPGYELMALAAVGLNGEGADREWLYLAARAPRDPRPGVSGDFNLTRAGWGSLIREYMDAQRLAPPALEQSVADAPTIDISRLLAPPVAAAAAADLPIIDANHDGDESIEDASEDISDDASPNSAYDALVAKQPPSDPEPAPESPDPDSPAEVENDDTPKLTQEEADAVEAALRAARGIR